MRLFITHKVAAIGCLLDSYGAYIAHLTSLTEDSFVRLYQSVKLKMNMYTWWHMNVKMFVGICLKRLCSRVMLRHTTKKPIC